VSSKLSRRWIGPCRWAVPLIAALACNACIIFVSTSPTLVSEATIVFVATDSHGLRVNSLHVTIVDVSSGWRMDGLTAVDGSFRCGVRAGVARVQAEVVPPGGYALARSESWPRQLDLSSGGNLVVDIHVTAR